MLIRFAIAVTVLKHRDAAIGRFLELAVDVWHVALHLGHPDATIPVKSKRNGVVEHRLGGDELKFETFFQSHRRGRIGRRDHRRGRNLPMRRGRCHVVSLSIALLGEDED